MFDFCSHIQFSRNYVNARIYFDSKDSIADTFYNRKSSAQKQSDRFIEIYFFSPRTKVQILTEIEYYYYYPSALSIQYRCTQLYWQLTESFHYSSKVSISSKLFVNKVYTITGPFPFPLSFLIRIRWLFAEQWNYLFSKCKMHFILNWLASLIQNSGSH